MICHPYARTCYNSSLYQISSSHDPLWQHESHAKCIKWWSDFGGQDHSRSSPISACSTVCMASYFHLLKQRYVYLVYRYQDIASYLLKIADGKLPDLHLTLPLGNLGMIPFEFRQNLWCPETGVLWLSCCIVCVIPRVNTDLWQTGKQTDAHTTDDSIIRVGIAAWLADPEEQETWIGNWRKVVGATSSKVRVCIYRSQIIDSAAERRLTLTQAVVIATVNRIRPGRHWAESTCRML